LLLRHLAVWGMLHTQKEPGALFAIPEKDSLPHPGESVTVSSHHELVEEDGGGVHTHVATPSIDEH